MPNRGLASRILGKPLIVLATAANNTPADGAGFDFLSTVFGKKAEAAAFEVYLLGGTQGQVDVTFQESNTTDVNASYSTIALANLEVPKGALINANPKTITFAANTAPQIVGYAGSARFIRAILSGTSGTPNFAIYVGVVATRMRHIGGA